MLEFILSLLLSPFFACPTQGEITSNYGYREKPCYKCSKFHKGIDISAPKGTSIVASRSGIVTFSGTTRGYGNLVVIDHGDGFVSRYAHVSKLLVHRGEIVEKGDEIALVGKSGVTTGNHLHYEVKFNGELIDPSIFLGCL
jgi:murein DD-endopeptidase MepM/ murein hydrolase activator NlpD